MVMGSDKEAPGARAENAVSLLAGLVGKGLGESFAPEIHMLEGESLDIRYVFRRIDLSLTGKENEDLPAVLEGAKTCGFNGLVITHPCKQAVIPHLNGISETAAILNAVNTVVFKYDGAYGHNTDWLGFLTAFRAGLGDLPSDHVVILGCGGAGAAMAFAMLKHGTSRLTLHDTESSRADELAARMSTHFPDQTVEAADAIDRFVAQADGIINATPIGMTHYPGTPVDLNLMRSDLWALDLNYFPEETELLEAARKAGARTMNGRHMSASQVAEQMRLFGGVIADPERILRFSDALSEHRKASKGRKE